MPPYPYHYEPTYRPSSSFSLFTLYVCHPDQIPVPNRAVLEEIMQRQLRSWIPWEPPVEAHDPGERDEQDEQDEEDNFGKN